jgi:hypothetical protein
MLRQMGTEWLHLYVQMFVKVINHLKMLKI